MDLPLYTERANAQPLVNMKTIVTGENQNLGNVIFEFLRLWYKYDLKEESYYVIISFRVINILVYLHYTKQKSEKS